MRYLLQTLSEEERERFEEVYISDDSEFEELEIAEEELIDRYVRGELSPVDKDRFDKMLTGSQRLLERVKVAKVLAKKLNATSLPVAKSSETSERIPEKVDWWNKFLGFSIESRLALAFGVLLMMLGSAALLMAWLQIRETSKQQTALAEHQRELDKQEAALKAQADELAKLGQQVPTETPLPSPSPQASVLQPTFASLTLSPGTTRSGVGANDILIEPGTSELRITLRLRNTDTDYPSYRASVVNANRVEVFPISDLKPRVAKNVASLNFKIPAKMLPPSDYMVLVYGGPPGAANEGVAEYVFRVVK